MYRFRQLTLLLGDVIMLFSGFWLGLTLRHLTPPEPYVASELLALFVPLFAIWLVVNYINGLYDLTKLHLKIFNVRRLSETALLVLAMSTVYLYLFNAGNALAPKTTLVLTVVCGYVLLWIWRKVFLFVVEHGTKKSRILFIGESPVLDELINVISKEHALQYDIVGVLEPTSEEQKDRGKVTNFDTLSDLPQIVKDHGVNIAIVSPDLHHEEDSLRELYSLLFTHVEVVNLTSFYEELTGRIPPYTFSEKWFLEHLEQHRSPIYEHIRTLVDYFFAGVIGIVFVATFPIFAALIKLTSRGPVFYTQERVGKFGMTFPLYKYRSMYALSADGSAETGGAQFAQKGDKRITAIGKLMRKTRIDEWPQVLNLLRRDISLIGRRPERPVIVTELEKRMPYYSLRHIIRPGLTGWAVIHQNYTDNYESSLEKLQYDLYYIKHHSSILDLTIILRTLNILFRFKGQ